MSTIERDDQQLPSLNPAMLALLAACVEGIHDEIFEAHPLIEESEVSDMVEALSRLQDFNVRYRPEYLAPYLPVLHRAFPGMTPDEAADCAGFWIAVRDLYRIPDGQLASVLQQVPPQG